MAQVSGVFGVLISRRYANMVEGGLRPVPPFYDDLVVKAFFAVRPLQRFLSAVFAVSRGGLSLDTANTAIHCTYGGKARVFALTPYRLLFIVLASASRFEACGLRRETKLTTFYPLAASPPAKYCIR